MFLDGRSPCNSASPARPLLLIVAGLLLCSSTTARGQSQELTLQFAPSGTTIDFTLGDILHTIHGSFKLKGGDVEYNLGTAAVRGALVVDTTSGRSGNRSRDRIARFWRAGAIRRSPSVLTGSTVRSRPPGPQPCRCTASSPSMVLTMNSPCRFGCRSFRTTGSPILISPFPT